MVSLPLQLVVLGAVLGAALAAAALILSLVPLSTLGRGHPVLTRRLVPGPSAHPDLSKTSSRVCSLCSSGPAGEVLSSQKVSFVAFITAMELPVLHQHEEEKFFLNARGQKETLPSIRDSPTKQLSVVVPSYNEEKRLPVMMDEALGYLEERQKQDPTFTYEVIVVDDGSKDQTSKVAFKYCQKYGSDKVRVITLVKNRGKGGAVKMGVFSSRGENILMADADGATKFRDIEKLEKGLNDLQPWPDQMAIACGSRAHLKKDSIAQRSYFRTLLMYGFHFLVWFLCVKGIRDTQCGFKLLTREAASRTFSSLHIERWNVSVHEVINYTRN
ncbi:dolichyl-phosphate beta-glucosyltransferase isoform X3 [Pteropus medius]|uniref:dolichyl-phosphate beta-glucosyltransferase isoform X3 n=1 Tax=Pteropus vampyrus TaxID=132908 RepID=UPI00196A9AA4|nr:dolichyl-phosphate beta-glucosyltransferase isoform X3 [Pteropus giganteus]